MLHISISPTTFRLFDYQDNENVYTDKDAHIDLKKAAQQHLALEKAFKHMITFTIKNPKDDLPDVVFVANGALLIPQIPNLAIMPYMKYKHRKEELPYVKRMLEDLGIETIQFPGNASAPFEGQAEIKWFHGGRKAICGYGFRATKKSFSILKKLLDKLYKANGLPPVELLILPLVSPLYYHLDVAMLEFDDTSCIVQRNAFSRESIEKIGDFLGKDQVHVIDTEDTLCLNAVVDGTVVVAHKFTDRAMKPVLERITGRLIKEVDVGEFEKSGGSVRCMVLDLHPSTAAAVAKKLIA